MTSPKYAEDTDQGRYYRIPGIDQPLISVTNANSVALAKYGLPLWYAKHATEAAWDHLPQMSAALFTKACGVTSWSDDPDAPRPCGACRDCITRRIKSAAEDARDSAANLGTRVHALAEAHVLKQPIAQEEGDDEAGRYVGQYLKFLADFDIDIDRDVVSAEATVVNEKAGYAGTLDIILRLPFDGFLWAKDKTGTPRVTANKAVTDPGERGLFLLDIKTSRTRAKTQSYPENLLQLAALKHATHMLLPDDTLTPMMRGITGAGTIQLRENGYELIPLPCATPEFRVFQHVLAVAQWRHHEWPGEYEYRPVTPAGKSKPKRGTKSTDPKAA